MSRCVCAQGLICASRASESLLFLLETPFRTPRIPDFGFERFISRFPERWRAPRSRPSDSSPIRLGTPGPGTSLPLHNDEDIGEIEKSDGIMRQARLRFPF